MRPLALVLALVFGSASAVAQKAPLANLQDTLTRVTAYLQDYFAHAQNIVADETVRVQELGYDLLGASIPPRTLRNELRISWEPAEGGGITTPQVLRDVISVNGRPPREKDRDRGMALGATLRWLHEQHNDGFPDSRGLIGVRVRDAALDSSTIAAFCCVVTSISATERLTFCRLLA